MKPKSQVVVIGNGAAAINAVEIIRSIDKDSEIIMVSEEPTSAYSRCLLPYYLSNEITREDLFLKDMDFYKAQEIVTKFGREAVTVKPEEKLVILENGEKISYDKLLIATGASPFIPLIEGIDSKGVYPLRTIKDADQILEWIESVKKAVVIGAGLIGLKTAEALKKRGINVVVVEMQDRVLPEMLDAETADIVKNHLEKMGITILLSRKVEKITGKGKLIGRRIVGGVMVDGEEIKCDLVIVAAGVRPNIGLVKGTGIKTNVGIVVDNKMRTSDPDIYAAGDVVEAEDVFGERAIHAIWPNATRQGKIAGYNIAGMEKLYDGSQDMNVIEIFGLPILSVGLMQGDEIIKDFRENKWKKIVLKQNRIAGMQFIGDIKNAGVILSLIKKGADVSKTKYEILKEYFGYARVIKIVGKEKILV